MVRRPQLGAQVSEAHHEEAWSTQQTLRVIEAMTIRCARKAATYNWRGSSLTDPRYANRFSRFPFKHPYLLVAGMLMPQLRHASGQIRVPDTVREGHYSPLVNMLGVATDEGRWRLILGQELSSKRMASTGHHVAPAFAGLGLAG
jgi:hypothetical protein